jgi:hypothetical protein
MGAVEASEAMPLRPSNFTRMGAMVQRSELVVSRDTVVGLNQRVSIGHDENVH